MPRVVVFDVGNVLVDWNPRAFFARQVDDPAALDRLLAEVTTLEWHTQHDAGRAFAETSAELIARFPDDATHIRMWGERFVDMIGPPLPGMAALIEALVARGVPLYALTNFSAEFWPAFAAREAALLASFRDILVSGAVGLIKPDPAIYAMAVARFGLARGEALFVDDRAENVTGAEDAGLIGHRFVDAPTLRVALERYGLLSDRAAG